MQQVLVDLRLTDLSRLALHVATEAQYVEAVRFARVPAVTAQSELLPDRPQESFLCRDSAPPALKKRPTRLE